jgi:hypothetical protein
LPISIFEQLFNINSISEDSTECTKERDTFKKCAETLMPELAKELGAKKQLKSQAAAVPNKTKGAAVQSKKALPKAKKPKSNKKN